MSIVAYNKNGIQIQFDMSKSVSQLLDNLDDADALARQTSIEPPADSSQRHIHQQQPGNV